jgi:iron complex outermembrane receptor protein
VKEFEDADDISIPLDVHHLRFVPLPTPPSPSSSARSRTPGTSFASGASRPVIRGFDANRVRVLENGIGSFDVSDVGPDHGVPIDPLSTQRIELVRGAATLRYGSQAIGGVVNAINNRVPDTLPDKPVTAEVTGGYGSGADSRDASALLDARAGQFAIHADAFDRHADDYSIPDGTQRNSYIDSDGYSLGGSYFFGDDHIGVGTVHALRLSRRHAPHRT